MYLVYLFIIVIYYATQLCGNELAMSGGALGKSTCQGERSGNSMTKEIREKRESSQNLWQTKSNTKEETINKGGHRFLLETRSQT